MGEYDEYIAQLEKEIAEKSSQLKDFSNYATTVANYSQDSNLIQWQLELDSILERVEHILKGDLLVRDEEGNEVYIQQEDPEKRPMNDYGVQLFMNTLNMQLCRNTILSYYTIDRINKIINNIGHELRRVIFTNYDKMGIDTREKKAQIPVIVYNVLTAIESAYRRAIFGRENENLKTSRIVTQNISDKSAIGLSPIPQQRRYKGGFLNPKNWRL